MITIHFMNKKNGTTIKNFYDQKYIPTIGDRIILQTWKGNYHSIVFSRRFVYDWKKSKLLFVEILLEKQE